MTGTTVGLRRDRATWLIYAQYCVFGFFLYAFTPSVTLLRDEEHVSDAVAGLHGTAYATGVIIVGLAGRRLLGWLGRRLGLWVFLASLCAGIVVYTSTAILAVSLTGALICGASGSGVAITVAATLADRHGPAGPAALAEANGASAGFGLLAPLAVGFCVHQGYGWQAAMLSVLPLVAVLALIGGAFRRVPAIAVPDVAPHHASAPLNRQFWLSWTIVVLCVGIEFCMTLWCAQLLRDRTGLSPASAATGVTALVAGLSGGRLIAARVARGVDWMLWRAFAVTAVGFVTFWLATVGWLSFAGLAACGLGMSLHYPLGAARAIGAAPGQANRASAWVSLGTGIAIGAAPFGLGYLADQVGVRYAFLLVPALLVLASAALLVAGRESIRAVATPSPPLVPETGGLAASGGLTPASGLAPSSGLGP